MKKQLSQAQANLIECLKYLEIDKDAIITIMLLVPKESQIADLAEYLLEHPLATESDILHKAIEINKTENPNE